MRQLFKATAATAVLAGALCPASYATVTYTDLYTIGKPSSFPYAEPRPGDAPANLNAVGGLVAGYGSSDALVWSSSSPNGTVLTPATFQSATAIATDGTFEVGNGIDASGNQQPLFWTGSASSAVQLKGLSGLSNPTTHGIGGGLVVGGAVHNGDGYAYALAWTSATATPTELAIPVGFTGVTAYSTDGTRIVGTGTPSGQNAHAELWNSTSAAPIDLNPANSASSAAFAVNGTQEVGEASPSGSENAVLWNGSPASYIDLNPTGYDTSIARDTNGSYQVGTAEIGSYSTAMLWQGSAVSAFDLASVLPSTFQGQYLNSYAISIVGNDIYGIAEDATDNYHAIEWTIGTTVPEPTGIMFILPVAGIPLLRRRRSELTAV